MADADAASIKPPGPGGRSTAAVLAGPAALLITLLLALQWPLRDAIGQGSTLANDSAQALFALYVAVAVAHAQRRGMHLVARADRVGPNAARWRQLGTAALVLPWCLYLFASSLPMAWQSLQGFERFPETLNPGYFLVKLAVLLLPLLLVLQWVVMLRRGAPRR